MNVGEHEKNIHFSYLLRYINQLWAVEKKTLYKIKNEKVLSQVHTVDIIVFIC